MCGPNKHPHGHGGHDARQQDNDTIEVYVSKSGVIRITTGTMVTAHATIGDAIEAFCRVANVTIEAADPVIRSLVAEHEHEHARIKG